MRKEKKAQLEPLLCYNKSHYRDDTSAMLLRQVLSSPKVVRTKMTSANRGKSVLECRAFRAYIVPMIESAQMSRVRLIDERNLAKTAETRSPTHSFAEQQDMVWAGLSFALRNPFFRNRDRVLKKYNQERWHDAVEFVMETVNEGGGVDLSRNAKIALITTMFECLIENMAPKALQKGPTAVLDGLVDLHWAVNEAYPGYLACGLLAKLIGARV